MPLLFESRPIYTTFQVNTPVFSPSPGTYLSAQLVSILDAVATASIYYTSDGTLPSYPPAGSTQLYSGPISINAAQTLNALAVAPNYLPSLIGSASYAFQAQAPTFSPTAGSYGAAQIVTIASSTSGASIYYTTDGTTPTFPITGTTQSYSGPVTVSATGTLKALSVLTGYTTSSVATAAYTISSGLVFTGATLPAATQYGVYSQSLASHVAGGVAPYFFSYVSGGINTYTIAGQNLTGTPNIPLSDTLMLQVIDSASNTATATFTVPVNYVVPAGALALGYTQLQWLVLNPNLSNINPGPYGSTTPNDFFNGYFGFSGTSYSNFANYSMVNGVLQIAYNTTTGFGETNMGTQNATGSGTGPPPVAGFLPYLANANGWYVDFGIDYTSWTSDCFGAVWLQSTEFNLVSPSQAINPAQPSYLKQYLEVDIWEAGSLGPATGYQGAMVYHNGVTGTQAGSNYTIPHFTNPVQTIPHVYGASWNPNGTSTFYVDNLMTGSYSILAASNGGFGGQCNATSLAWLNTQHMYALWSMQSHGAKTPYSMNVYYIAAFVPPTSPGTLTILFPQAMPAMSVGTPVQFSLSAIGGTGTYTSWSGTNLPPGITLTVQSDGTGLFAGTPTTAGNYSPNITVNDSGSNFGNEIFTCTVS